MDNNLRILIAIKSCLKDKRSGYHQVIRDTWGKNLPTGVDVLFFIGGGDGPPVGLEVDERWLPVHDGYWEMHEKAVGIVKYAVWKDYDFCVSCDTDTYIDIPRFLNSGFHEYDYSGACINPKGGEFGKSYPGIILPHEQFPVSPLYAYISGGHGYILSRAAMRIVAASSTECGEGEDLWVGYALGPFILAGEITAKLLPSLKDVMFHLNCGYYGSGRKIAVDARLNVGDRLRDKHTEVINMALFSVLVTGSSGYIGTRLTALVREAIPSATIHTCDVKQGKDYANLVSTFYDVVFHLGAISTIFDSFERADEMMKTNALNLIPFFQNNTIKKIVFSSTGAIYGNMKHPMKEDEARWLDCLCPYAQTKYVAEGIIRAMCPNHFIARFGNVFSGNYGPREEWLAPTHFMKDNPIVLFGGDQIRDFVHIDVICRALIDAALRPDIIGTYNLANGEGVRLEDMAKSFSEKRGVPIVYKDHRAGDAKFVVLDVTKAREAKLIPETPPINDYFEGVLE